MRDRDGQGPRNPERKWQRQTSVFIDSMVGIVSPKTAYRRQLYRFGYDAVKTTRLGKPRGSGGTGDVALDENSLFKLRETCRDLCLNNPIARGLLETERDSILGSMPPVQARTLSMRVNAKIERLIKSQMYDAPVDISGRFNWPMMRSLAYYSYRRDGDHALLFVGEEIQHIEGDQIGTPFGRTEARHFDVVNGIAFSKLTKRLIGYYIGAPDENGFYIKPDSYQKYTPDRVCHVFHPRRSSQSRGEPALSPSIKYIDQLSGYIDAELVAARVNACFSMFIGKSDVYDSMPGAYTGGSSSSGYDKDGGRLEKMEPGLIMYGEPGDKAEGIGQNRPGTTFDPFVERLLSFIGRPLCIPLMLVTLDFSGATFMNARIAYQKAQEAWEREQSLVVRPLESRIYRWKIQRLIENKELVYRDDIFDHEVLCRRWPYVDPYKEAMADKLNLENHTNNRTQMCARLGSEWGDIEAQRQKEDEAIVPAPEPDDNSKGNEDAKPDDKSDSK